MLERESATVDVELESSAASVWSDITDAGPLVRACVYLCVRVRV
jgi:hypothetical protein